MTADEIDSLDWSKASGLLTAIVQNALTGTVLMVGYVNRQALELMLERGQVVLYSRSRQKLWVKGETSGNTIAIKRVIPDCDRDALLVLGTPSGPVCHTGAGTCFANAEPSAAALSFLATLERVVTDRIESPKAGSYSAQLMAAGIRRIAQKVGEEAVEVALAAQGTEEELLGESADLLFHLLVLLRARGLRLADVTSVLRSRSQAPSRLRANDEKYFRQE